MGIQREVNQSREDFPSQAQAEVYRATRAATDPDGRWVVFETEEGTWAVARAEPGDATSGSSEPRPRSGS